MKKLLSTILFFGVLLSGYAQSQQQDSISVKKEKKEKKVYLWGFLSDSFTRSYVPDVKVVILRADSSLVDSAHVDTDSYRGFKSSEYYLEVPAKPAKYIIKCTHPDYETTYKNYEIKHVARNREFEVPSIRMKRIQRSNYDKDGGNLQEVVVKATKVKMVYKGDTIVFNADAFNIPEGSMLDGLIKQLPGVELKDDGEIFVNGKKIENLTLNGADFFKGKNKMMLENLPYYTVKNVQVFNKRTPKSEFLGRDVEEKEFTMDVQLKKEYKVGGTVNLEAGYGTDDRYKARGFGLRYTDMSRLVLFGGMNNLNEYIDYDREGNEQDRTQAAGDRNVKTVGGSWSLHAPEERVTNDLTFKMNWEDVHSENERNSENFLAGASTFGQSRSQSENRPFQLNLNNTFYIRKPIYLYSWLNIDYNRYKNWGDSWSLTANDQQMTDSVNHTRSLYSSKQNYLRGSWDTNCDVKLPWGDELELGLDLGWQRQWNSNSFSQDYYTICKMGTVDQRNQYSDSPYNNYDISGSLSYRMRLTENLSIAPRAYIGYNYNNNDSRLYRLDWLGPQWAVDGQHAIGELPETDGWRQQTLDASNSSEQGSRENQYSVGMMVNYSKSLADNNGYLYYYVVLSKEFRWKHMYYDSDVLNTTMNRNYNYPKLNFNFHYSFDKNLKSINAYGSNSISLPDIGQLVDITQTNNPLNIRKGNSDLKPMTYWWLNTSYRARVDSIDQHLTIGLNGNIQHNAMAMAYTYDATTGVRTTWTENINGNWNMGGNIDYGRALDKKKFWHIGANLSGSVGQSTDMASIVGKTEAERNRVTNTSMTFAPNLRYQKEKLTFTLRADATWRHIHRSIEVEGLAVNMYDFNYGFNANYKLPWNFTIDTDLQMHSRRGYADSEMNYNRLYWDANLTKSWKQGRWVAKIKAYDILAQASHWQYWVNSTGRTEMWTNNMRRYVLFSLAYRFSLTPKK
ncbi:MAG: outer membrane beta-barrel family protein [Prevotella sp.]|nr:outer membrane beta-barrel family protein [Prevotella sp.]